MRRDLLARAASRPSHSLSSRCYSYAHPDQPDWEAASKAFVDQKVREFTDPKAHRARQSASVPATTAVPAQADAIEEPVAPVKPAETYIERWERVEAAKAMETCGEDE